MTSHYIMFQFIDLGIGHMRDCRRKLEEITVYHYHHHHHHRHNHFLLAASLVKTFKQVFQDINLAVLSDQQFHKIL